MTRNQAGGLAHCSYIYTEFILRPKALPVKRICTQMQGKSGGKRRKGPPDQNSSFFGLKYWRKGAIIKARLKRLFSSVLIYHRP